MVVRGTSCIRGSVLGYCVCIGVKASQAWTLGLRFPLRPRCGRIRALYLYCTGILVFKPGTGVVYLVRGRTLGTSRTRNAGRWDIFPFALHFTRV